MKLVQPIPVTDAALVWTNVNEDDYPIWNATAAYAVGARVIHLSTHRIYESVAGDNVGHDPATGATEWVDVGPTNRWAMFAPEAGPRTQWVNVIDVTLAFPTAIDALGLIDIEADSLRLRVLDGETVEYETTIDLTGVTVATFTNLPVADGRRINVTATTYEGSPMIGKLLAGVAVDLGDTQTGPTVSINDYSRRQTDDFGVTTVVERAWAKRLTVRTRLESAAVDEVQRHLAAARAKPALWIGESGYDALTAYGTYNDFSIDLQLGATSFCSLTVEGLPSVSGHLPANDPAADGRSDLRVLRPIAIDDMALISSNIAEDDHPQWLGEVTYAAGARVIHVHRIYESLVADNLGSDPSSADGKWMDVGPTNRWAMFDQAMGTATTREGPITVTLAVPGAVSGLAVLDVAGASVRVQAPGYDRLQAIEGGSQATLTFLDIDVAAGADIVVTIAGANVSVGTLLVGPVEPLGVTETTPTIGINDFSRKATDDFGNTSFVERAWAKRMSVRSLIRTDAVDVMVRRMASLRATPALWMGADDFDSLMIYGFYRDFAVEIGATVSPCTFTVEGLTTAGKLRQGIGQVGWGDVIDNDPAHPKPEDGATVGAPPGTDVGGKPAEDVADAVDEVRNPETGLGAQRVRLDEILVDVDDLRETYGDTASAAASAAAANVSREAADAARLAADGYAQASASYRDEAKDEVTNARAQVLTARNLIAATLPADFQDDGAFWTHIYNSVPPEVPELPEGVTFPVVTGRKVLETTGWPAASTKDLATRGFLKITPGRRYRVTVRARTVEAMPAGSNLRVYITAHRANYSYVNPVANAFLATNPVANQWYEATVEVSAEAAIAAVSDAQYLRAFVRNAANGGLATNMQVEYLRLEDITESATAKAQAEIATSQATTATGAASAALSNANLTATYVTDALMNAGGNQHFDAGLEGWGATLSGAQAKIPTTQVDWVPSYGANANVVITPTGVSRQLWSFKTWPVQPGRRYRLKIGFGVAAPSGLSQLYFGISATAYDGSVVGDNSGLMYFGVSGATFAPGWHEREGEFTFEQLRAGTTSVRLVALLNYNNLSTASMLVDYITIEDITESASAASSATIAEQQAVDASGSASLAQQGALLSASIGQGALNPNPIFTAWDNFPAQRVPNHWNWQATNVNADSKVSGENGLGNGFELIGPAGLNAYTSQSAQALWETDAWYVIEADVKLTAGSFAGAGVLFRPFNTGGASQDLTLSFAADPDSTGEVVGGGTIGRTYRFRKLVQVTLTGTPRPDAIQLAVMSHWSTLGSIAAANKITWYKCLVRPATPAEIRDKTVLAPIESTVSRQEGALATLQGKMLAYLQTELNAGAATVFASMRAETNQPQAAAVTLTPVSGSVGLAITGRNVEKISGASAWATAYSTESYTGSAYVSGNPHNKTGVSMLQLSSNPTAGPDYSANAYAIYFNAGTLFLYEGASSVGNYGAIYEPTDTFAISYDGTTVNFLKNGKVFRSTTTTAGRTFHARAAMFNTGARINNIVFGPQAPTVVSEISFGARELHIYNPVGNLWAKALSVVGGDVIISGKLNVNGGIVSSPDGRTSFDLNSNRIVFNNGAFMKVTGVGFGSASQFIEWYGPSQSNLANCTEMNAVYYLKTNGQAYFGGSLHAGTLKTAESTSSLAANASVTTPVFGSNGGDISVILSYSYGTRIVNTHPATAAGVAAFDAMVSQYNAVSHDGGFTYVGSIPLTCNVIVSLERKINDAPTWTPVATLSVTTGVASFSGTRPRISGSEVGISTVVQTYTNSLTYMDTARVAQNRQYRATITGRTGVGSVGTLSQLLTIVSSE